MDNLKLILNLFLFTLFISTVAGQSETITTKTNRIIIDTEGAVYFQNEIGQNDSFVHKKMSLSDENLRNESIALLTGYSAFYKKRKENRNWMNFQVFKDRIFTIVVSDSQYEIFPPVEIPGHKQYHQYFIECNVNSKNFMDGAVYDPYKYFLELDNYEEIGNLNSEYFNYDFINLEDDIYLFLSLDTNLYIYKMTTHYGLPKVKWKLQNCIPSLFKNEYFILSKKNENYIIHTESQGEYELSYFLSNPKIAKLNSENLRERFFVEDKRINTTYVLTKEEGRSLMGSDNHISTLNSILEEKNK